MSTLSGFLRSWATPAKKVICASRCEASAVAISLNRTAMSRSSAGPSSAARALRSPRPKRTMASLIAKSGRTPRRSSHSKKPITLQSKSAPTDQPRTFERRSQSRARWNSSAVSRELIAINESTVA